MEEIVLEGPKDNWRSVQVPLGTRLTASLKTLHKQVIQVYPDADNHSSTGEWVLRRAASEGAQLRVLPGEEVGIVASSSPHFAPALVAVLCAGAVAVPIGWDTPVEELTNIVGNLSPRLILCSADMQARVLSAFPGQPVQVLGTAARSALREPPATRVEDLRAPAVCLFTSGSTGLPKKIPFSHAAMDAFINSNRRPDLGLGRGDVIVTTAPMFWAMGFMLQLFSMDFGLKLVIPAKYAAAQYVQHAETYKATLLHLDAANLCNLCKAQLVPEDGLPTVRCILSAGTCLNARTERFIESTLKKPLVQWYGITETLLTICGSLTPPYSTPAGSVGHVNPWVSVKVVDVVSGKCVKAGVNGELQFLCPYNSINTPSNEWFHSGDYGHYDERGYFYIVDRVQDLIRHRGTLVAPSELEGALLLHPAVREAVVVGLPDDAEGMLPAAVVAVAEGHEVSPEELRRHVAATLKARSLGNVVFVQEVPRTPTGKPKRRQARALCQMIFARTSVAKSN